MSVLLAITRTFLLVNNWLDTMNSWLVRIAAALIGLLLLYASFQSPNQSLVGLAGAALFFGLAALSIWGRSEPHIFLAIGLVFSLHPALGLITGEISEFARHAPHTIVLAKEPEAFWGTFSLYCLFTVGSLSLAAYHFWRGRHGAQPTDQPDQRKEPRRPVS